MSNNTTNIKGTILGFPRMGKNRELKKILESHWKGEINTNDMLEQSTALRKQHLQLLVDLGLDEIPVNDFSLYDHVLDTTIGFGVIPSRYKSISEDFLSLYFAMARGEKGANHNITAMEMSKWFDTNYHYIIPEFTHNTTFNAKLIIKKIQHAIEEAKSIIGNNPSTVRPVLIGPISFLLLGKMEGIDHINQESEVLKLLPSLLESYVEVLQSLEQSQVQKIQLDEPFLAFNISNEIQNAYKKAYTHFQQSAPNIKIFLASYFDDIQSNIALISQLPVETIHIDGIRGDISSLKPLAKTHTSLSLGVIDGRNIWKADINALYNSISQILSTPEMQHLQNCYISSSCSLLHSPFDLSTEYSLDSEIQTWLSFAIQKVQEITTLKTALDKGKESVSSQLSSNKQAIQSRINSSKVHNEVVKNRVASISDKMLHRNNTYTQRSVIQKQALKLPSFPTTTIGSYPQTKEIRNTRAAYKKGNISYQEYQTFMQNEIQKVVSFQEEVGLDVLVHGEPERNDMVEYFGENFEGFISTSNGWVQSYGSRCVKPPIIYGDLSRKKAITVDWISYAQSLSTKPIKGMLTGPVTILQWSFVRDDQPRYTTAYQIALIIRDEIKDLEKANIKIIQVDEPAIREGLPLQKTKHKEYLDWAVKSFRIATCGVKDETQIHTHMCYSEFNEIIDSIAQLDADVISIEASRSKMELLEAFKSYQYPNEIGPGIYDIHSPRIPSVKEMVDLLQLAEQCISKEHLWVNPDCGLKTRNWNEVKESLINMVQAAKQLRN